MSSSAGPTAASVLTASSAAAVLAAATAVAANAAAAAAKKACLQEVTEMSAGKVGRKTWPDAAGAVAPQDDVDGKRQATQRSAAGVRGGGSSTAPLDRLRTCNSVSPGGGLADGSALGGLVAGMPPPGAPIAARALGAHAVGGGSHRFHHLRCLSLFLCFCLCVSVWPVPVLFSLARTHARSLFVCVCVHARAFKLEAITKARSRGGDDGEGDSDSPPDKTSSRMDGGGGEVGRGGGGDEIESVPEKPGGGEERGEAEKGAEVANTSPPAPGREHVSQGGGGHEGRRLRRSDAIAT